MFEKNKIKSLLNVIASNKDKMMAIRIEDETGVIVVLKYAKQYLKSVGVPESIRKVPLNNLNSCSLFIVFLINYVVGSIAFSRMTA